MKELFLFVFVVSFSCVVAAQEKKTGIFRDSIDGAIDLSQWLFELHGFLPIINVITEPAVGYGGTAVGIYFISKEKFSDKEFRMPDMVAAGAGYTQNRSWFAGAAYTGFWKNDRIRYRGVFGYAHLNLKYYGIEGGFLEEHPAKFSLESVLFLQQLLIRVRESPFLLGGRYFFSKTKVVLFDEDKLPEVDLLDFDLVRSGIELITEFETFNNFLSPTRGMNISLSYSQSLELLGSDRNMGRFTLSGIGYIPLMDRWNMGLRLEALVATQDPPFYGLPYINLRGVPALRYQGDMTLLTETEHMINVYRRWSLVGFAGIGSAAPDLNELSFDGLVWNVGSGFRYLIARQLGLQMGIDVARGPENWAFYIVFGNAWLR